MSVIRFLLAFEYPSIPLLVGRDNECIYSENSTQRCTIRYDTFNFVVRSFFIIIVSSVDRNLLTQIHRNTKQFSDVRTIKCRLLFKAISLVYCCARIHEIRIHAQHHIIIVRLISDIQNVMVVGPLWIKHARRMKRKNHRTEQNRRKYPTQYVFLSLSPGLSPSVCLCVCVCWRVLILFLFTVSSHLTISLLHSLFYLHVKFNRCPMHSVILPKCVYTLYVRVAWCWECDASNINQVCKINEYV